MKAMLRFFSCLGLLMLIILCIFACSSSEPKVKHQVVDSVAVSPSTDIDTQRSTATDSKESISLHPSNNLPFAWHIYLTLDTFIHKGIANFYPLYGRVPVSFNEYLKSGIPMLIPNDYVTGETYRLVDDLDMNDTTGFTFWSDGADNCRVGFVINSSKTGQNEIYSFELNEDNWSDYKTVDGVPGIRANVDYDFDLVKRNYCVFAFTNYLYIYNNKYSGQLPGSLNEMLNNEGTPIEAGWKWTPDEIDIFEFGIDSDKRRYYIRQGCCLVTVRQIFRELHESIERENKEGEDVWYYFDAAPPPDVIEEKPIISSRSFYDGYLELISES